MDLSPLPATDQQATTTTIPLGIGADCRHGIHREGGGVHTTKRIRTDVHHPSCREARGQQAGTHQRDFVPGEADASARSGWAGNVHRAGLKRHLLALHRDIAARGLQASSPQQDVPPLGVQQQTAFHGEQAAFNGQIPLAGQAELLQGGRVGAEASRAQDRGPNQGGGGGGRGAKHIKASLSHPQAGGGGEVQLLDIGKGADPTEPDSPRGEPDEVGPPAQGDGLVDEAAQGVGDAHHDVAVAPHIQRDARDAAPGIEGGEAVKEVGPGGGPPADRTGTAEAAASGSAIHHTAETQRTAGGGDLTGGDGRGRHAQ
ncbi:hypothetical protein [Synechococcus sp. BA-132 BA5]|uniref:hypothetical protein n=1 Tax=Synechococcus sp. BA-132 BA5 TaxID=3110252 RepID=UPI002B2134C1|nr:hypothetical protein [Synechococcus sp. BA-132 BA5]MEA5414825.1 hypothetical protein [Synechococcus sp. BA-132 BA5]